MGIEFIRKAAPAYRKGLDRRRVELSTPTLFTRQPDCAPRAFAARVHKGKTLTPGEKLGICLDGEQVTVLRGLDPVAVFTNPPAELKVALSDAHGEACGQVKEFHDIAGMAEISVW
jgi:hypothetical protein